MCIRDSSGSAGFKLLGSNIVFSSAPANGHAFFGVINAGADYVTAGSEFPDGSVTAPSFTFQDDQDTGWYRNASGDVGYSSNGSAILNFDGNGLTIAAGKGLTVDTSTLKVDAANNRVGIGLTAPATNFHVKAASPILRLEDSTDPQGTNGSIGKIEFYGNDGSSGGVDVRSYIQTISTNSTGNEHALVIGLGLSNNAPTEKITILGDNKVGIATTSPKEIIDSRGAAVFSGDHATSANAYGTAHGILLSSTSGLASIKAVSNGSNNVGIRFVPLASGSSSEAARLDSSGRLLIASTTSRTIWGANPQTQIEKLDSNAALSVIRNTASASGPWIALCKSRGSANGAVTIVQNGDSLGSINWFGADGVDLNNTSAEIRAEIDGTPGSDDVPGRLIFKTTADGAASPTEALRLDSSQNATFAGRLIGAKAGNSALSTPSLELYGSQSGATFGDLRFHNWGDSSGDYWQINSNLGLDSNGNTDKVDDSKKGAGITIDGRAGRIFLKTSHDGTSATNDVLIADSSGNATFGGTVSDSKGNLRSIPLNTQGSAYTLVAADAGKAVLASGNITIADSVFSAGDAVTIINNTNGDITINKGSVLYYTVDGTSANRTLGTRGMATIYFTHNTTGYISGAGLS